MSRDPDEHAAAGEASEAAAATASEPPPGRGPAARAGEDPKRKRQPKRTPPARTRGKAKETPKTAAKAAAGPSVATHPRAAAQVRRAKGWGGLGGFALAAYLSYRAGIPPEQIGIRALAAGMIGYMLAWACAVAVWRHLVLAELRATSERLQARRGDGAAEPAGAGAAEGG